MRTFVAFGIALLILTSISVHSVAQTRVTGRIFAEVVELTGAEANTNQYIELKSSDPVAGMDLGEISFRGKADTTYELLVSSSPLKGSDGFEHYFETHSDKQTSTIDASGNDVIRLSGSTGNDLFSNSDRQYDGNYQVVFAYN